MKAVEYTRICFSFGNLDELNRFGSDGWRVVAVTKDDGCGRFEHWVLLEREAQHG